MLRRSFMLMLATFALAAWAQPAGAAARCLLQKVAEMPVTMVGLRPTITAKINGVDVRLFIDTGSLFNILNPETAARIGLQTGALPPYLQMRGLTGEADMRLAVARDFTIMGVQLHQADFLVAEHGLGGADGLIGEEMLAKFDVEFDLANGVARLFLPKDCSHANLAYWNAPAADFIPIRPIEPPSDHIIGPVSVDGVKIDALFDTGTPRSALTLGAAKRAGVRTDAPGVTPAGTSGGAGRRVIESWLAPFDSFEIGGEQVKGTKLRVADFELEDGQMLLGVDFFLSHHILISRSQGRLYFTYNGGPVFSLEQGNTQTQAPPPPPVAPGAPSLSAAAPITASDFVRRAAAAAARREFDTAADDYSQAIALEPNDPQHLFDRGLARALNHQPQLALADFDAALKLRPDFVPALMVRGQLRLESKDAAAAGADFDAAMKADPGVAASVGLAYARAGLYASAVDDFDRWIATHPRNEDAAGVLASRCRARAMWGQQLDKAFADCNQSLGYRPGDAEVYASRGLVKLRLGQLDAAIGDFNTAVHMQPKASWALYGRGVAELRKGDKAKGDADMAAATAITPGLAAQAAKVGIAP